MRAASPGAPQLRTPCVRDDIFQATRTSSSVETQAVQLAHVATQTCSAIPKKSRASSPDNAWSPRPAPRSSSTFGVRTSSPDPVVAKRSSCPGVATSRFQARKTTVRRTASDLDCEDISRNSSRAATTERRTHTSSESESSSHGPQCESSSLRADIQRARQDHRPRWEPDEDDVDDHFIWSPRLSPQASFQGPSFQQKEHWQAGHGATEDCDAMGSSLLSAALQRYYASIEASPQEASAYPEEERPLPSSDHSPRCQGQVPRRRAYRDIHKERLRSDW